MAQERSCLAICKGEADCGGLFVQVDLLGMKKRIQSFPQDNFCHLVAPSVTSLDASVAMESTPGVDSYAIVEQVIIMITTNTFVRIMTYLIFVTNAVNAMRVKFLAECKKIPEKR